MWIKKQSSEKLKPTTVKTKTKTNKQNICSHLPNIVSGSAQSPYSFSIILLLAVAVVQHVSFQRHIPCRRALWRKKQYTKMNLLKPECFYMTRKEIENSTQNNGKRDGFARILHFVGFYSQPFPINNMFWFLHSIVSSVFIYFDSWQQFNGMHWVDSKSWCSKYNDEDNNNMLALG